MGELAITVIGPDRPGIIADVSEVLSDLGVNLTDSTMTLLRGHFAMMLVCSGAASSTEVEGRLSGLAASGLITSVRPIDPEAEAVPGGERYVLTVHGADRLGIVAAVTRTVSGVGGNITDLSTRLAGTLYLLVAEVDLPSTMDLHELTAALHATGETIGVEVGLRAAEADVL